MPRLILAIALLACVAVPVIAQEAGEPPILELRLEFAADTGPLAGIADLPAMTGLAGRLTPRIERDSGIHVDLPPLIADLRSLRLAMFRPATPGAKAGGRFELELPTTVAGLWSAITAAKPAASDGFVELNDTRLALDGPRLVVSEKSVQRGPAALVGEQWLHLDFSALSELADSEGFARAIDVLKLGVATGTRRDGAPVVELPGAVSPLAAIDPAVLARLPANPLLVLAAGIDGERFGDRLVRIGGAGGDEAKRMRAVCGGWTGTWFVLLTPSAPFPAFTLGFPASPVVDAGIERLLAQQDPSFTADRASAATVAVSFKAGLPFLLSVRRQDGRWLIGSDVAVHAKVLAGNAGGFAAPGAAGAGLYIHEDRAPLATLFGNLMAMGVSQLGRPKGPDEEMSAMDFGRESVLVLQQALVAAAPGLTPVSLAVRGDDAGVTIDGDGVASVLPQLGLAAAAIIPNLIQSQAARDRARIGNQMRQLVTACIAWETDHDDAGWPTDLPAALAELKIPDRLLRHPTAAVPMPHILYVRPVSDAAAQQPVLIENPACEGGASLTVAYADGHVSTIRGAAAKRVWAEAQRLAALDQANEDGIGSGDWAAVAADVGLPKPEAGAAVMPQDPAPAPVAPAAEPVP